MPWWRSERRAKKRSAEEEKRVAEKQRERNLRELQRTTSHGSDLPAPAAEAVEAEWTERDLTGRRAALPRDQDGPPLPAMNPDLLEAARGPAPQPQAHPASSPSLPALAPPHQRDPKAYPQAEPTGFTSRAADRRPLDRPRPTDFHQLPVMPTPELVSRPFPSQATVYRVQGADPLRKIFYETQIPPFRQVYPEFTVPTNDPACPMAEFPTRSTGPASVSARSRSRSRSLTPIRTRRGLSLPNPSTAFPPPPREGYTIVRPAASHVYTGDSVHRFRYQPVQPPAQPPQPPPPPPSAPRPRYWSDVVHRVHLPTPPPPPYYHPPPLYSYQPPPLWAPGPAFYFVPPQGRQPPWA